MSKKITITIVVIFLFALGGWLLLSRVASNGNFAEERGETTRQETGESMADSQETAANIEAVATTTVVYTDNGFAPEVIEITQGDTVTFQNDSSRDFWPASNVHPTHTLYPGSSIAKCNTDEEPSIFDACKGIAPGEAYSFTFNEAGTWGYHNHLQANFTGKIIVDTAE